jgi:hypothetical protein
MQNIVLFNIRHNEPITIKHNGSLFEGSIVNCVNGVNEFTIEGVDYQVIDIEMFGMGSGELIKHAIIENNTWKLKYEYPVFSWLHKILNHGWLLKEDDE